jgi:hypothetical protein
VRWIVPDGRIRAGKGPTPDEIRAEVARHRESAGIGRCASFIALADLVAEWLAATLADQEIRHRMERGERHGPPPTDEERLAAAERLSHAETALARTVRP